MHLELILDSIATARAEEAVKCAILRAGYKIKARERQHSALSSEMLDESTGKFVYTSDYSGVTYRVRTGIFSSDIYMHLNYNNGSRFGTYDQEKIRSVHCHIPDFPTKNEKLTERVIVLLKDINSALDQHRLVIKKFSA